MELTDYDDDPTATTESTGALGLYALDGRINADLPPGMSGDLFGRVRFLHLENDEYNARLEVIRDSAGRNKGNTKDSGIHRYDFWDRGRRGCSDPFGMTRATFEYDEETGILVWQVHKKARPDPTANDGQFDPIDTDDLLDNDDPLEENDALEEIDDPLGDDDPHDDDPHDDDPLEENDPLGDDNQAAPTENGDDLEETDDPIPKAWTF